MNVRTFAYPSQAAWSATASAASCALLDEIVSVVSTLSTDDLVGALSKIPKHNEADVARRKGINVFLSPKALNEALRSRLHDLGWWPARLPERSKSRLEIDFVKCIDNESVMLEVQFGKYAFVAHDIMKFNIWNGIDARFKVGIELMLDFGGNDNPLQKWCSSGIADFDASVKLLQLLNATDAETRVPVMLLGMSPNGDTWQALRQKNETMKGVA